MTIFTLICIFKGITFVKAKLQQVFKVPFFPLKKKKTLISCSGQSDSFFLQSNKRQQRAAVQENKQTENPTYNLNHGIISKGQ